MSDALTTKGKGPKNDQNVKVPRPNLVYRGGWGALPPKQKMPLVHPVSHIVYTFTGTNECNTAEECALAVQALQRRDMNERGLSDIQFNFLVGGDATVYEGRGWLTNAIKEEKHSILDGKSIDIAYIGDFSETDPSEEVLRAGGSILSQGLQKGYITQKIEVVPYRKKSGDDSENPDSQHDFTFIND